MIIFSEYGESNVINGLDELKMFANISSEEEKKKDATKNRKKNRIMKNNLFV